MADHPEPTEPRIANQSTYSRLYGYLGRQELGSGNDVWYLLPNTALVQIEGRTYRFDPNFVD